MKYGDKQLKEVYSEKQKEIRMKRDALKKLNLVYIIYIKEEKN